MHTDRDSFQDTTDASDDSSDASRRNGPATKKRRTGAAADSAKDKTQSRTDFQKSRNVGRPVAGILARTSALAVFSNHLFALARPDVQEEIGQIVHQLLHRKRDDAMQIVTQPPTDTGASLAELARRLKALHLDNAVRYFEEVVIAMEAAVLGNRSVNILLLPSCFGF